MRAWVLIVIAALMAHAQIARADVFCGDLAFYNPVLSYSWTMIGVDALPTGLAEITITNDLGPEELGGTLELSHVPIGAACREYTNFVVMRIEEYDLLRGGQVTETITYMGIFFAGIAGMPLGYFMFGPKRQSPIEVLS